METMLLTSLLLDLAFALMALIALWSLMRLSDYAAIRGESRPPGTAAYVWADTVGRIQGNALAAAIYYAGRWAGACVLLGLLLG